MKLKTPYFIIEFEVIFLIVFFSFLFSNEIRKILFSFYICYLFIIFHELSHIFIAALFGKEINSFKFSISGVNIEFNNVKRLSKFKEILIYFAGPISNLFLALIFSNNKMIFEINLCLCIINLLPIYPLDGYNIIINILRNTKLDKNKYKILNYSTVIILIMLFFLSIIQFIYSKNIFIFIFFLYILCIYLKSKEDQQLLEFLAKIRY